MASYRDSSINITGSTTTATALLPAAAVDNDYLIVSIGGKASFTVSVVPSGWTLLNSTSSAFYVYGKLASSEPTSWDWTINTATKLTIICVAVQDCDQTTPKNASGIQANASSINVTAPSITTTVDNCFIVGLYNIQGNTTTFTSPAAGQTEAIQGSTSGANGNASEAGYETFGTAGATGTRTATASLTGVNYGCLVAVAPFTGSAGKSCLYRYATM